jgi:copper(I)-binding protein
MRTLALAAAFCLAVLATAHAQSASPIEVTNAWARATKTANGAVYLTLTNHGTVDDRLVAVSTPAANKAELHTTLVDQGVMKMRPIDAVPVKAGGMAEFKPEGKHIMLLGLKHPLVPGDTIPLTLTFEKAGTVDTMVKVMKKGHAGSGDMPGMKM